MSDTGLESSLRSYLRPGEMVRWRGAPARGLRLSVRDIFLIPFSAIWFGFAIFWMVTATIGTMASGSGATMVFPLFGVPFVVIGLYVFAGRFLVDAWVRGRTIYAVTDRRALVLRRVFSESLIATDLGGEVRVTRSSGGRGDIEFGAASPWPRTLGGSWAIWNPSLSNMPVFIGIDDVMGVYRLVDRSL
jgi:hypothetical protein